MKLIIVSNRLPVSASFKDGRLKLSRGTGGMALGFETFLSRPKNGPGFEGYLWIGWPGGEVPEEKKEEVRQKFIRQNLLPVFLSLPQIETFYNGFANDTLWPLFHFFPGLVNYSREYWDAYKEVNELFAGVVAENYSHGDVVWVHDYHLMLVPKLLREKLGSAAAVGFFLHVPFPSFELFRLLPDKWRRQLLLGVLGADLIGFHTYDYTYHFHNTVQRILGLESNMREIISNGHITKIDTFPMGIDFQKFNRALSLPAVEKERRALKAEVKNLKVILSVDRLDYTKGIVKRLKAYSQFLEKNKLWHEKVIFLLVVVPSRMEVLSYQEMKSQIDELVGQINGQFGNVNWTPIIYQFKSLDFESITAMYGISDIALVTPLRDGMNLVAKEYIATRRDQTGVLILSEMAGAAAELGEAMVINPNHEESIAEAIATALEKPVSLQKKANAFMQERLLRYDIVHWAGDFVSNLLEANLKNQQQKEKFLTAMDKTQIIRGFKAAKNALLFLDYDGTLVPYSSLPMLAGPTTEVKNILTKLAEVPNCRVVLISGRDKATLDAWFKKLPISLVAEHGMWIKDRKIWKKVNRQPNDWQEAVLPVLKNYADRLPGAFVEEKDSSLVWHYRLANPLQAQLRVNELTAQLVNMTAQMNVQVVQGRKNIEVKTAGVDKGSAAEHFLSQKDYDFVLGAGDDVTDEDMFKVLPESAFTIRIGSVATAAKFVAETPGEIVNLLEQLV